MKSSTKSLVALFLAAVLQSCSSSKQLPDEPDNIMSAEHDLSFRQERLKPVVLSKEEDYVFARTGAMQTSLNKTTELYAGVDINQSGGKLAEKTNAPSSLRTTDSKETLRFASTRSFGSGDVVLLDRSLKMATVCILDKPVDQYSRIHRQPNGKYLIWDRHRI